MGNQARVNSRDLAALGSRHRTSALWESPENLISCILYPQSLTGTLFVSCRRNTGSCRRPNL